MKVHFPDPTLPPFVIVDDCEDDVFLLRHRLREGGITNPIRTFSAPADALAFLRSAAQRDQLPELLFTDIKMPQGCGLDLIASIRETPIWDSMRIAVATASNRPTDLERALALGVDGYLIKFPPSDLLTEFVRNGPWFAAPRRTPAMATVLSA
jgi:CheY-like chemotaxis protein